jgi:hypothetical protein
MRGGLRRKVLSNSTYASLLTRCEAWLHRLIGSDWQAGHRPIFSGWDFLVAQGKLDGTRLTSEGSRTDNVLR